MVFGEGTGKIVWFKMHVQVYSRKDKNTQTALRGVIRILEACYGIETHRIRDQQGRCVLSFTFSRIRLLRRSF